MRYIHKLLCMGLLSLLLMSGTVLTTPAQAEPATNIPTYVLHAGDIIRITVWKEDGMDQELTILPDGTVNYPLIGVLPVAGKTPAEVQTLVKEKLARLIPSASVTVSVKEARGNSINVVGQVARPGDIIMNRPLTIMQALSQAGGLTNFADETHITILRKTDGKETALPFDYAKVTAGEALTSNISLTSGDVIVVPTASLF